MSEKYEFIDAQYAEPPAAGGNAPTIICMCKWLGVSKSGFYEWRSRPESATVKRREELKLLITRAFGDSDGTYGYRRIWRQLARWGVHAGLELVRALMRELGLVACQPRPWRPSTTKQGQAGPIPDLVNRDFSAAAPGEKMVGDITYIPTWEAARPASVPGGRWEIITRHRSSPRPSRWQRATSISRRVLSFIRTGAAITPRPSSLPFLSVWASGSRLAGQGYVSTMLSPSRSMRQ